MSNGRANAKIKLFQDTSNYTMKAGKRDKLVISLHCEPVDREKMAQVTVTLSPRSSANAVREVREIQFAGIAKGHRIPS